MGNHTATEYYEIVIDDPILTEHGFTKFSLPLNGNGKAAATKMIVHNTDKSKMMYPTFYKSDLDSTVQSLAAKIVSDGILIDNDTAEGLIAYFKNAGVLLSEDQDSIFFKNGNGKAKPIATKKNTKAQLKSRSELEQERQQKEEKEYEERIAAIRKNISSFEEWQVILSQKYQHLYDVVQGNLPNLWHSLEFDLSIYNILHIKDCTLPFAGIVLGKPSSLKTVGIEMFRKSRHIFYTDKFTSKSFVSHNTGVPKDQLVDIDLLPKIKNKCFLTPELAPIFAARDEDLIEILGTLTRVLDGHGYESDSGAHGHRGYNERMMFTWIGAAVDIPFKVHKLLTTLGPKSYFFRVPKTEQKSDDNYYLQLQHNDFDTKRGEILQTLTEYQDWFKACPSMVTDDKFRSAIRKMPWISDGGSHEQHEQHLQQQKDAYMHIIKLGKLLAHLRGVVPTWHTQDTQGSEYGYGLPIIEEPDRAMLQLANLARGHALLTGRNYATVQDIPLIVKVVLSTAPMERVSIFDVLLANNGILTVNQITEYLNVSEPTARRTMTELKALGLVDMQKADVVCSDGIIRNSLIITLKEEFGWFLTDEFKTSREGFIIEPAAPEEEGEGEQQSGSSNNGDENQDGKTGFAQISDPKSDDDKSKVGRPKTDWNNVLENNPMKEKFPPPTTNINVTHVDSSESEAEHSAKSATMNSQRNKNTGVGGGQISFTASYPIEDSSSNAIAQSNGEIAMPSSVYRLGHSDRWACKDCNIKGDKWFMLTHPEYCKDGNHSKQTER